MSKTVTKDVAGLVGYDVTGPTYIKKYFFKRGCNGYLFIAEENTLRISSRITFNHLIINSSKEDNYFCTTLKSNSIVCLEGFRPRDCKDLRDQGSTSSGVYTLYPARGVVIKSYCDMRSDGGGWTAFQKRSNESVDFFRTWIDYKNGFGDIEGNYWLGNDNLHLLLRNGESEMRMDMEDFHGNTRFIQYSRFTVGSEESSYRATLSNPSGNVEDCWTSNDFGRIYNTEFAAKDRDNQNDCSNKYKGGWWYVRCHCANPNGLYLSGQTSVFAEGMTYKPWLGHYYSLKSCELTIRRK